MLPSTKSRLAFTEASPPGSLSRCIHSVAVEKLVFTMVDPRAQQPKKPGFGEANMGAMVGAIIAGIGGLFAINLPAAIFARDLAVLFENPTISLLCWLISGPTGWVLGGQIGPRLGLRFRNRKVEIAGGIIGGLVPVVFFFVVGWYADPVVKGILGE